jgi:hypothetical protein
MFDYPPLPPEPNERLFSLIPPPRLPPVASLPASSAAPWEADPSWHHHPYPIPVGPAPSWWEGRRRRARTRERSFKLPGEGPEEGTFNWSPLARPTEPSERSESPPEARQSPGGSLYFGGFPHECDVVSGAGPGLAAGGGSSPISRAVEIVTGLDLLCWVGRPKSGGWWADLTCPRGWCQTMENVETSSASISWAKTPRVWRPPGKAWPSTIDSWFFHLGPPLPFSSPLAPKTSRGALVPCQALSWRHFLGPQMRRANERQPAKKVACRLIGAAREFCKTKVARVAVFGMAHAGNERLPSLGKASFRVQSPKCLNPIGRGPLLVHCRLAAIAVSLLFLSQISTREPYQIDSPKSNTCHAVIGNRRGISSAAIGSLNLRLSVCQSQLPACRCICSCTVCRDATARHRLWLTANKRCLGPIVSRQRRATSRVRADMSRDRSMSLISRHSHRIIRRVSQKRDAMRRRTALLRPACQTAVRHQSFVGPPHP